LASQRSARTKPLPKARKPQSAFGNPISFRHLFSNTFTNPQQSPDHDYNDIIKVLVGTAQTPFSVHKHTICSKSKFFQTTCSSKQWLESEEKSVALPHIEPEIFKAYVHWMYTKTLSYGIRWGHSGRAPQEVSESEDQWSCVEAYILSGFLDYAEFRKAVLNKLIKDIPRWRTHFSGALVTRIWTTTSSDAVLRTFVWQWMVARWNRTRFLQDAKDQVLPEEFVTQVTAMALGRVGVTSMGECVNKMRAMYHRI
jgi:hypothetical protein